MKKLVVFTGAGISAESCLATFRDSNGLWNNHKPEDVADIRAWERNPEFVLRFYNDRRNQLLTVDPNAAHFALAELQKDFDVTIITQNIDDLHERAGSTDVIHLHGELMKMCSENDKTITYPYKQDLKLGDIDLNGSQLRPFVVWFGEIVPMISKAIKLVRAAELFACIGTSLDVYPAADLVNIPWSRVPKFLVNKKSPVFMPPNFTFIEDKATTGVITLQKLLLEKYI